MITRSKLTKKIFMKLPKGTYIVSNVFFYDGIPIYAGWVSAFEKREKQWRCIAKSSAAQRLCNVFRSKEDAGRWLAQLLAGAPFLVD